MALCSSMAAICERPTTTVSMQTGRDWKVEVSVIKPVQELACGALSPTSRAPAPAGYVVLDHETVNWGAQATVGDTPCRERLDRLQPLDLGFGPKAADILPSLAWSAGYPDSSEARSHTNLGRSSIRSRCMCLACRRLTQAKKCQLRSAI